MESIQQIRNRSALADKAVKVLRSLGNTDGFSADMLANWDDLAWDLLARQAGATRGTFSNNTKAVIVDRWHNHCVVEAVLNDDAHESARLGAAA